MSHIKKVLVGTIFLFAFSNSVVFAQQYDTTGWTTLKNYQPPDWYLDAKFGIYAHWGLYSIPAFGNEWYGYEMYDKLSQGPYYTLKTVYPHHVATYGDPGTFGYKDFIPLFKAENFNADTLMSYVANAGARIYAHLTSHHDSYIMYGTAISRWNCVNMGPKKDVGLQVLNAIRKYGLRVGISNHLAENDWFFQFNWHNNFDAVKDTSLRDFYNESNVSIDLNNTAPSDWWCNRWMALSKEMIDFFQPDYVYYDRGWSMHPKWTPYRKMLAAYQYNQAIARGRGVYGAPGVVLLYKDTGIVAGGAILDWEGTVPDNIQTLPFQTDISVADNWGYVTTDGYKTTSTIVNLLANVVSKNGTLMLSINPKADGTLPDSTKRRLTEIGGWMAINSEAIYATRPFSTFGVDGTNQIRFTRNKDSTVLYVFSQNWPGNGTTLSLTSLRSGNLSGAKISKIILLGGSGATLTWSQDATALSFTMPTTKPAGCNYCYVFKVYLDNGLTLPAAPSNLTAAYLTTGSGVALKWVNNSTTATGFSIERKIGSSGLWAQIATTTNTVSSYTDLTISSGVVYDYRVRAYNANGNSGYSNEATTQNQPTTGIVPQLTKSTLSPSGLNSTTAIGHFGFNPSFAGKAKEVSVYSLAGKIISKKILTENNIDLQKDFGISKVVYLLKVKNIGR
jgi:alpha-L-fucosidase